MQLKQLKTKTQSTIEDEEYIYPVPLFGAISNYSEMIVYFKGKHCRLKRVSAHADL